MAPGSKGAEPGHAIPVCVNIGATADKVPVCTPTAQNDNIQLMSFEINPLRPVLYNRESFAGCS